MQIIKPKLLFFLLPLMGFFSPVKAMADTIYILGCFPDYNILSHHNPYADYTKDVKNCDLFSQFDVEVNASIDNQTNATSNPELSNISITKGIDSVSPFLFSSMVNQESISLKLFIYKINIRSELRILSEISVTGAVIKEVESGFEGDADNLYDTESLSLSFQKIEFVNSEILSMNPKVIKKTSCLNNQNKTLLFSCDNENE